MIADERLAAIRIKIEWAKKHIRDLDREIQAFFDSEPYVLQTKLDLQPARRTYYLAKMREIPVAVSLIAGDALHNLRSTLDHLAYQLVLVGTGGAGLLGHVYFPIAEDAAKYEATKMRKIQGMRKEAIKAIDAIKPYKGGNDTVWRLHRLDIIDKHRLILTARSRLYGIEVGHIVNRSLGFPEGTEIYWKPGESSTPLNEGDELYICGPSDLQVDYQLEFALQIAFCEPEVFESEPVLETLQDMANAVDYLVTSFKPLLA